MQKFCIENTLENLQINIYTNFKDLKMIIHYNFFSYF
jgi:predicted DNA-binding ArsR family transcriptional regulator